MSVPKFDAIVVGARVAGAATALQLARGGARVLLVDRAPEIGDTLSTHALMRPAVALLERWGLAQVLEARGTPSVTFTRFQYGSEVIDIPMKPDGQFNGLMAPRRYVLDAVLLEAAVAAGAMVRLGTSFEGALFDGAGQVRGAMFRAPGGEPFSVQCDLLIGADGRMSGVAKAVSAPVLHETKRGPVSVYGYFRGLENRGFRWMFGSGIQAGLIPTNDGYHCVFVSCQRSDMAARFGTNLAKGLVDGVACFDTEAANQLRANLSGVKPYRFPGAPGHLRAACGPGWAIVGDAGYFKDPSTAHGISDACLDAWRLSNAILSGRGLAGYEIARDRAAGRLMHLSAEIGELNWSMGDLKAMHRELSDHIRAEVEEIQAGDALALAA